ncbi:NACHT domain protein [Metarhizium brunneum]
MAHLVRNTALGTAVRLLSRDTCLCFPVDSAKYQGMKIYQYFPYGGSIDPLRGDKDEAADVKVNWWFITRLIKEAANLSSESDDDPVNPQSWAPWRKMMVSSVICVYTFTVHCGSSIFVPSEEQILRRFHVSEGAASLSLAPYILGYGLGPLLFSSLGEIAFIGRNPVYIVAFFIFAVLSVGAALCGSFSGLVVLRFLQGFFGSPCLATGAATFGDMFSILYLPYPLAAWSGAMYAGPALAPILSAFAVEAKGWRRSTWEIAWLSVFLFAALVVFLPETAAPTLLYYKAKRLRQKTGCLAFVPTGALWKKHQSAAQTVKLALIEPFEISVKDPAVAFINMSLVYGMYYSFFKVFPLVYPEIYHMSPGLTGAVFICVLVSCILGTIWYCAWYHLTSKTRARKLGTFDSQETSLRPGLLGVLGVPVGMFLSGWTSKESVPWEGPALGIIMYCGCSFVVGLAIFIHISTSYPQYAASLFAADDALRSAFASGAILYGRPLYVNMGVVKGCSLKGGLSVVGVFGYRSLYRYGPMLRAKSKFTAPLPEEDQDTSVEPISVSSISIHGKLGRQPAVDDGHDQISPVDSRSISTSHHTTIDEPSQAVVDDAPASDLWSAAYREAVESLGEDIDVAILKGKGIEQLFHQLEELNTELTEQSAFLAGVEYLQRIKVPLEKFKLALDLATPLTDMQPVSAAVFGVVKGVTAIAISFAAADVEFAKKIGEMLEQMSYIDECDTLGQKSENKNIHKALVSVYEKILEFYQAAYDILTRRKVKLVLKIILENDKLPAIIGEFITRASNLRNLIHTTTLEVVQEIQVMLYDQQSKSPFLPASLPTSAKILILSVAAWLGRESELVQSEHHDSLQAIRADEACEFLLKHAHFLNWYCGTDATGSQKLAMVGDMGSGKSVSMAFLVDELVKKSQFQLPRAKVYYYYCQPGKTDNYASFLSTWILQLLEDFPAKKKAFVELYNQARTQGDRNPGKNKTFLERILKGFLGDVDRLLFIAIDGLDEFDRRSRKQLVEFLDTSMQVTSKLKVVLSTRPEDEILELLGETPKIYVSSHAGRDGIIVKKIVNDRLNHLSPDVKGLIIRTLSERANGSAIWTNTVVHLIEGLEIRALGPMKTFLEDIPLPDRLHTLYSQCITKCTSNRPENKPIAVTALKFLSVVRRPLSILELSWAVTLALAGDGITSIESLADLVDSGRVMSLIRPFVAHIDFGDVKKRQVRLLHLSVKDFVTQSLASSGMPHTPSAECCAEMLEAELMNTCVRYLLLDEVGQRHLFSDEQLAIEALPQEVDLFNDDSEPNNYTANCSWDEWEETMIRYDPTERGFGELFVYASCYWVEHWSVITTPSLVELASIEKLCEPGSTRIHNWIEQNRRPGCVILPRVVFDPSLYDPLGIAALFSSPDMFRHVVESSDFSSAKFLPESIMRAADQLIQWGDICRLRMLPLDEKAKHRLLTLEFFRLVIHQWFGRKTDLRRQNWDGVFDFIYDVLDVMIREKWAKKLFCAAAAKCCLPMIQRLVGRARINKELESELCCRDSPDADETLNTSAVSHLIQEAKREDDIEVVEYLIKHYGTEVRLPNSKSREEDA